MYYNAVFIKISNNKHVAVVGLTAALDMLLKVSKVIAANKHDRYNHINNPTAACTVILLFLVVCVIHTSLFV